MEIIHIIWIVAAVLFAVAEGVTEALVSAWFFIGSLVALLLSAFFPDAIAAQVAAFLVVSIICLIVLRPLVSRLVGTRREATNADANVGKVCQVVTEVQPGRFGRVKLEGLEWTAKSDHVLPVGTWCRVDAIEGVKVVVTPLTAASVEQQEFVPEDTNQ